MNDDWRSVPASSVARIEIGGTPAREQPTFWADQESGHAWASIADLRSREVVETAEYISGLGARSSNAKLVPAGTPIMSFKLTIGRTSLAGRDLYTNEAIAAFFADPTQVDWRYLFHTLPGSARSVITDVAIKGATLNKKSLSSMRLLLPPIEEQRRLAEILDSLDEQISETEQIVSKLNSVQVGLMRSLLGTRSVGPSETRQRDIPVPPGWRSLSLADVVGAPITYGIVQAGPHVPGGVPYVRTGDMSGVRLSVEGMLRTSQRIANSYVRSTVHAGELVCAIRATVGKVLPVPPELDGANLTQGTARIAPGRSIDPRFLYWEMCGERVQDQIALAIKGTTFFEITLAALRQVRVAMPSLPAQREIAEVLDTHEALVRRESDLLAQLQALKAGLMDDLLTGRVRVPEGAAS